MTPPWYWAIPEKKFEWAMVYAKFNAYMYVCMYVCGVMYC